MIYCLAAYGIELEPSGQLQGVSRRNFLTNTLSAKIPRKLLFLTGDRLNVCHVLY